MRIHFDYVSAVNGDPNKSEVSSSDYDSMENFKSCLGFLLDEWVSMPIFDSAGILIIDDSGISVCDISLVRIVPSDSLFDIAISLNDGDKSVCISRYHQSIFHFWYYLNEICNT